MKIIVKNSNLVFAKKLPQTHWDVANDGETTFFYRNNVVGNTIEKVENLSSAYIIIDGVSEGDKFKVSSKAGNSAKPWSFVNANNVVLSCSSATAGTIVTNEVITAPSGTSKAVFNIYDDVDRNFARLTIDKL